MPYTWFITDIDGTLLDEANALSPENRAALEHLKKRGVPIVLATGRRWTTLRRLLDRMELGPLVDYVIFNNGMRVKNPNTGKVLHAEVFPQAAVEQAAAVLEGLGWDPLALTYEPAGGPDVYHRRLSLRNGDFTAKNDGLCTLVNDFSELEGRAVLELVLLGSEAELARAQRALEPFPLETALIKNTFYADHMLEITPRGVSKLTGAQRLGEHLGLSVHAAVAAGDSANDLPLLRGAGRAVAMADAPDAVRFAAHETATVAEAVFRHFP